MVTIMETFFKNLKTNDAHECLLTYKSIPEIVEYTMCIIGIHNIIYTVIIIIIMIIVMVLIGLCDALKDLMALYISTFFH